MLSVINALPITPPGPPGDVVALLQVEKYRSSSEIRVRDTLMDMRHYRMGLVQTFDQLRFSYLAIIEGIRRIIHIPSHDSGYSVEASVAVV